MLALSVLVICGVYAFRTFTTPAPLCDGCNVILVSLDAMSAESIADGLPLLAARAAKEGVQFAHAYAPAKRQTEGHAAILTGAYPWDIGLLGEMRASIPKDAPLLSETFASYGYATGGFVQGSLIDAPWGFSRGFLEWDHPAPGKALSLGDFFSKTGEWVRAHGSSQKPYFLYVNPYDIYSFFDADGTPGGFTYADMSAGAYGDADALARAREAYTHKLTKLDSYLTTLLDTAQSGENGRKTVVVVTASYGEYLTRAPQEEVGSAHLPKSRALLVPLIFFIPDTDGKRVVPTVESRNVAATILEVVGGNPAALSGDSLVPYIRSGEGKNQLVRSYVPDSADEKLLEPPGVFYTYVERAYRNPVSLPEQSPEKADTRGYLLSLIYDVWHLVKDGSGKTYLFDTVRDPGEKTDVSGKIYTLTAAEQQNIGVLMGAVLHEK